MERLLELSCNVLNGEAEIEFAVNLDRENALPMEIGFVQVRPMLTPGERTPIEESDLEGDDVLVSSDNCLGQGARGDLTDVVYLRPQHFDRGSTRMMASELDAVNRGLVEEGRHGVFIGLGRWGTTDDRFGVPVKWAQISAARVIVEATMPDAPSNLSHGTHFFHRLLSNHVLYMSVEADGPRPDRLGLARQLRRRSGRAGTSATCGWTARSMSELTVPAAWVDSPDTGRTR